MAAAARKPRARRVRIQAGRGGEPPVRRVRVEVGHGGEPPARRGDMAEPASSRRRTRGRGEREWVMGILGRLLEKIKFWEVIFFL